MCKAAEVSKAAHSSNIEISARLRLVIAVYRTNIVKAWKLLRHRVVKLSQLTLSMCERTRITEGTSMIHLPMSAQFGLVLEIRELSWIKDNLLLAIPSLVLVVTGLFLIIFFLLRFMRILQARLALLLSLLWVRKIVFGFITTCIRQYETFLAWHFEFFASS